MRRGPLDAGSRPGPPARRSSGADPPSTGRASACASPRSSRSTKAVHGPPGPVAQQPHPLVLLAHVRHDLLRRVRRGGGPQVGHVGRAAGGPARARWRRRPAYGTRRPPAPAARRRRAADPPHCRRRGPRRSRPPRRASSSSFTAWTTCGHRVHALHGDVAHLEADGGPAAPGVLQDVPLGGRGPPADQPDRAAAGRAAASCGRRRTAPRRPGPSSAAPAGRAVRPTPTGRISVARSDSCPRGRVPLGLGEYDDPGALAHHVGDRVEHLPVAGDARRRCRATGRAASGTPRRRPAAATAG